MPNKLAETRLFLREFRRTFHTTGAILPSGGPLARSLARYVDATPGERKILEVGPGTGSVTAEIVRRLGPNDSLHLVEINERFATCLRDRFDTERKFTAVAARTKIIQDRVQNLANGEDSYDTIISGLPLNNFSVSDVSEILGVLRGLLRPGGTLSFFEYARIRGLKSIVARGQERVRLRGIDAILGEWFQRHEFKRDTVYRNFPPAYVHHLRFTSS